MSKLQESQPYTELPQPCPSPVPVTPDLATMRSTFAAGRRKSGCTGSVDRGSRIQVVVNWNIVNDYAIMPDLPGYGHETVELWRSGSSDSGREPQNLSS